LQLDQGNVFGSIFEKLFYTTPSFGIVQIHERGASKGLRKSIVFFFVFFTLASLGLALVPQVSSQPENIKVLSYNWYVDSFGYLDVVGEVQNVGPNTIDTIILSGTVYTSDGQPSAYSYPAYVWVKYLLPQQKAPFYMQFDPQNTRTGDLSWLSLGFDHVDFTVNLANVTSNYQYPDLTVESSSGGIDGEGAYWASGTVKNTGSQTATTIRVIGTFFNASGNVVAVGYTTDPLSPASLTPASVASFRVGAFDLNQSVVPSNEKIYNFTLLVQAEEPVLSGTAPSPPPSTPTPSDSTPSPSSTQSPGSNNPNPIAPETRLVAVIVLVIIVLAAGALLFRRRKSQAKVQAIKDRKSQVRKKRK
jgi:preprotein translocase subunit SecG